MLRGTMKDLSSVAGSRNPNRGLCALRVLQRFNTGGTELLRDLCVKSLQAQRTRRLCWREGQLLGAILYTERAWDQWPFSEGSAK